MDSAIAVRLNRMNREFYTRFAREFAESRTYIQPGIRRACQHFGGGGDVLDVGCGDGRVGAYLARSEFRLRRYTGIDFSEPLLERARRRHWPGVGVRWMAEDLTEESWVAALGTSRYDAILCLSVLFHLSGARQRRALVQELGRRLEPGGRLVLSSWLPRRDPRLHRRSEPVRGGTGADWIIDWRRGGVGYRYVRELTLDDLVGLGRAADLKLIAAWSADGRANSMGCYAVFSGGVAR